MKRKYIKIHLIIRNIMPYMVMLMLVMSLINTAKLRDVEEDINSIRFDIEDTRRDIAEIYDKSKNNQVDNSEVIQTIKAHHKVISQQIDEAERQIKANTVIWSK